MWTMCLCLRRFILQPIPTIEKNLADKVRSCEEKVKSIESSKVYLERSIKEGEENLRELILSKKREQTHWCTGCTEKNFCLDNLQTVQDSDHLYTRLCLMNDLLQLLAEWLVEIWFNVFWIGCSWYILMNFKD